MRLGLLTFYYRSPEGSRKIFVRQHPWTVLDNAKMVTKFGLAVLQVNLGLFNLNLWMKKFFVYNCDLNLSLFASMLVVLLDSDNLFINKLKTKSNSVLNRMVSNTERIHNFFGRARAKQMPSKVYLLARKCDGSLVICVPQYFQSNHWQQ